MVNLRIGNRLIGPPYPVYIVAEMSANHSGDFNRAVEIITKAKEVGADAVKIQTYTPDTITIRSDKDCFKIKGGTLWDGKTLHELYGQALTPWEWQPKLKAVADKIGIDLFSSAFDPTAVDFLEKMGVPAHKVASFELVDIPLIEKIARTGKPLIMSTGMATQEEIGEAVTAARNAGAKQIALLKCTSSYPASPDSMNLKTIKHMSETFKVPVGLSDHTLGIATAVAGVTLGACIIEKHFILSKSHPSPDAAFSLEPQEFKAMVEAIRTAERALGKPTYGPSESELKSRVFRRSLFVIQNMKAGEKFTSENIRSIRPGHGLAPKHLKEILGQSATQDISRGTPLAWDLIKGHSHA